MKKLECGILVLLGLISIVTIAFALSGTVIAPGTKQSGGMVIIGESTVGVQSGGSVGFLYGDPVSTPPIPGDGAIRRRRRENYRVPK